MSGVLCTIRKVLADARAIDSTPLIADFLGCASGLMIFMSLILIGQEIVR